MMQPRAPILQQRGQIDKILFGIAGVVILGIIIVLAVLWLSDGTGEDGSEPESDPVPAPAAAPELETVRLAESEEERGDDARAIIRDLRAAAGGPDYAVALERARELQADQRLADAQLLYFFAARGGHAPAAFELATLYDPNHHPGDDSLLQSPDPTQAFRLYRQAQDAGYEDAGQRLSALRAWTEEASAAGDAEAQRLLLLWESST